MDLKRELIDIAGEVIRESLPDAAVRRALKDISPAAGRTILVSAGKAGWQMAKAAHDALGGAYSEGYVITKYGHSRGAIGSMRIFEAGHPQIDQAGIDATGVALRAVENLRAEDRVLLLLSGGGSMLLEKPLIPLAELQRINAQLLASGASILEINTIRKRMSAVKGGKFAQRCAPAEVYSIILSDVVGDRVDVIASGPACPDASTVEEAQEIARKYKLALSDRARALLCEAPVQRLGNAQALVTGGVGQLCESAVAACARRGYDVALLTNCLGCEAREAGRFLGSIARTHAGRGRKKAFIAGGETVVRLKGGGKGGRNQELALAAADEIRGLENVAVMSVGSDGTDGPTDAAGGVVDGRTAELLASRGISIYDVLEDNDAYRALDACGGLVITGATGTNVNDVSIVLIDG